eukprot:s2124_g13.t2
MLDRCIAPCLPAKAKNLVVIFWIERLLDNKPGSSPLQELHGFQAQVSSATSSSGGCCFRLPRPLPSLSNETRAGSQPVQDLMDQSFQLQQAGSCHCNSGERVVYQALLGTDAHSRTAHRSKSAGQPVMVHGRALSGVILWVVFCATSAAVDPAATKVHELSGSNFDSTVRNGHQMPWFVKFHAPWCGHCKKLAPVWEMLAEKLEGTVALANVDATVEEGLAYEWEIEGYPTLILVSDGHRYRFRGSRTLESLEAFAAGGYRELPQESPKSEAATGADMFGGPDVVALSGNFDSVVRVPAVTVLIVFYLRGCGHCRDMEGTWGALAKELKDKVLVASVDALANRPLAELWAVERFPTIKLVRGGQVYDFDGARTVEDLQAFALEGFSLLEPSPLPPLEATAKQGFYGSCSSVSPSTKFSRRESDALGDWLRPWNDLCRMPLGFVPALQSEFI